MSSSSDADVEEVPRPVPVLPSLVLRRICTFLCSHCEPMLLRTASYKETQKTNRKTLMNLCLASKALRFEAEPILYHHVELRFEDTTCQSHIFVKSALRFMRNLQDRPQLRNLVKVLDVHDSSHVHRPSPIQNFIHFDRPRVQATAQPLFQGDHAEFVIRLAASAGVRCLPSHFTQRNVTETFVQLMLIFLPGLTDIRLGAQRSWEFRLLLSSAPGKKSLTAYPFLSKVRTIEFGFAPLEHTCGQCMEFLPEERDSLSDESLMERPAERFLIKTTAANLRTLVCTSAALQDTTDLPNLESLRVDVRDEWPGFESLLAKLTSLRQFSYQFSTPMSIGPEDIVKALKPLERSIESLKLEATQCIREAMLEWQELDDLLIGPLQGFTRLRYLSMDVEMVCLYTPEYETPDWIDELDCFITFLPTSLEILHIKLGSCIERPDSFLASFVAALTEVAPESLKIVIFSSNCWNGVGFKVVRLRLCPDRWKDMEEWSISRVTLNWKFPEMERERFPNWKGLLLEEGYLGGNKR